MRVIVFDKVNNEAIEESEATTRGEAVRFAKQYLNEYKEGSDRIAWGYTNPADEGTKKKPDYAYLIDNSGAVVDFQVIIKA